MKAVSPFFTWRRAMTSSDLPSTTKLVLFVIAEYANEMDDVCWPAIETIAEKCSLSDRCVSNHLGVAEERGWIARWKSRRPSRRWAHGHYRLSIPEDVARRQRDAIDFDLAADAGEPDRVDEAEQGSSVAQETGIQEPDSGNAAGLHERRSEPPSAEVDLKAVPESYRNHVPTNNPVNRNTSKPSLTQTLAVNHGESFQREKSDDGAISMAHWMLERVRKRLHDFATPDMDEWARCVEMMQSSDGRALPDIARLFAWADRDKFWSRVITSPARLQKNWDELRRRRNAALETTAAKAVKPASSPADDRVCAHVENGCRCTHAASTIIGAGSARRGYCRKHIGEYED